MVITRGSSAHPEHAPLTIEPYERGRFKVGVHGEEFFVDICTNRGVGSCNCFPYLKYLKPRIAEAIVAPDFKPDDKRNDELRCGHIKAARTYYLELCISKLIEMYPDNEEI
jgi:hypothetical protein